jgi:hypothetical protein
MVAAGLVCTEGGCRPRGEQTMFQQQPQDWKLSPSCTPSPTAVPLQILLLSKDTRQLRPPWTWSACSTLGPFLQTVHVGQSQSSKVRACAWLLDTELIRYQYTRTLFLNSK